MKATLRYAVVGTSHRQKLVVGITLTKDQAEVWAANLRGLAVDSNPNGWIRFDVVLQAEAERQIQDWGKTESHIATF